MVKLSETVASILGLLKARVCYPLTTCLQKSHRAWSSSRCDLHTAQMQENIKSYCRDCTLIFINFIKRKWGHFKTCSDITFSWILSL